MSRRDGFTLIETVFVMIVASVILVVLTQMFFGVQKNVGKGEQTLDFLRQSTILLDRVRADIRSAARGKSVDDGSTAVIRREAPSTSPDEPPEQQTVTYTFNEEGRYVTRSVSGGKAEPDKDYGRAGPGLGFITKFKVVKRNPEIRVGSADPELGFEVSGFYEVILEFATEEEVKGQPKDKIRPRATHRFRALVCKRAPEEKDDLWKPNKSPGP